MLSVRGIETHGKYIYVEGEYLVVGSESMADILTWLDTLSIEAVELVGKIDAINSKIIVIDGKLIATDERLDIIDQAITDLQEAVEALQPPPEVKIAQVIHSLPSNYEIDDIALLDWLANYATNVTQIVIHDIEGKSTEYWEQFAVILLPYGYGGSSLVNLLASEVPIISVEEEFADDLELGDGTDTFKASTRDFYVRNNAHPITSGLPLGAWVWSGSGFMWTQATDKDGYTEATVLVDNGEVGKDILIVHNIKKYAFFGWYRASQLPDEGWNMIKKTIEWAIGYPLELI